MNGPSGKGVDDLYTPEVTNAGGLDNTVSVVCTAENDQRKVQGIINEINGLNHEGTKAPGTPAVFGMNFQAVSVGEKLAKDNSDNSCVDDTNPLINQQPGGYLDGNGTPSAVLTYGMRKTDEALASMIVALKNQGIYESTLFIVTAKHGQSPINPVKTNKPGHFAGWYAALPRRQDQPSCNRDPTNAANCATGPCGFVQDDDIALIWLQGQNISGQQVANYLNINANALFIDEVLGGNELKLKFNNPATDSRTPDADRSTAVWAPSIPPQQRKMSCGTRGPELWRHQRRPNRFVSFLQTQHDYNSGSNVTSGADHSALTRWD